MKTRTLKTVFVYTGILALQFFVCGTIYLSQVYHLLNYFTEDMVTTIAMTWNYLAQASGMLIFIFLFMRVPRLSCSRISYAVLIVIGTITTAISLLSDHGDTALFFTVIFNFMIGLSSGFCLTLLTSYIPKRILGLSFGIAYAVGSIGSYIISNVGNGNFLQSKSVIIVYLLINIIRIIILYYSDDIFSSDADKAKADIKHIRNKLRKNIQIYLIIALMIILVNVIMTLGNDFQLASIKNGKANLPLSRAFYAISLSCAGLLSVKSRKLLAIACFVSLLYPVVTIAITGDSAFASALLTITYLFMGFSSVFRSLSVMDIAAGDRKLLAFACSGLMLSRVAEATYSFLLPINVNNKILANILFSVLYALLLILFFVYMQKTNHTAALERSDVEADYVSFAQKYGLTPREKEILDLLVKGHSNHEIIQVMFISENTVKFHVKNILKKTNCINRAELVKLYRDIEKDK